MDKIKKFNRCIYCFARSEQRAGKDENVSCPVCGWQDGLYLILSWQLPPGTILKGRYVTGKVLKTEEEQLVYLGWDLKRKCKVKINEYYPQKWLFRDNTASSQVNCAAGHEKEFEQGIQDYLSRARLYYSCTIRVKEIFMDMFTRNETCYYVRDYEDGPQTADNK